MTEVGGSIGSGSADKRYRLCRLASQEQVPLVMMLEDAGHRVNETANGRRPGDFMSLAELSRRVPLVNLVCGASAGHGALTAPLSNFIAMTESASIVATGPLLVRSATGEDVTNVELGGPSVAVDSGGVVHNVVADDRAAIALARRYLAHFPLNAWESLPRRDGPDAGRRRVDLLPLIPPDSRRPHAIRPVFEALVDGGALLDVQQTSGSPIVTALAHPGGRSIAIVAIDPSVLAGTIDGDAADKAAHFLDVADAFDLPCLFVAGNPGVLAGTSAGGQGILRHAARLFAVQHRMRVPKLHMTLRKVFGFGSTVMAMNPFDGQTVTLALPSITLGALPAAPAASGIDDPDERARVSAEQSEASVRAAARSTYDDVSTLGTSETPYWLAWTWPKVVPHGRGNGGLSVSCPDAVGGMRLRWVQPASSTCLPTWLHRRR